MNVVGPQIKGVRRIVRLEQDQAGGYAPVVLYDRRAIRKKKKKTSRAFRPLEKMMRQTAEASVMSAADYRGRHRRSSEKKRDGWLHDLGKNIAKSQRTGSKRLKPKKVFGA